MKAARFRSPLAGRLSYAAGACALLLAVSSCGDDPSNGPSAVVTADGGPMFDGAAESGADAAAFDAAVDAPSVDGSVTEAGVEGGMDGAAPADAGLDGAPLNPCVAAGIDAAGDPFAGIYSGLQTVTRTYTLNAGSAEVTSETDACSGNYTVTSGTTASLTLACKPLSAAGSPEHTDTGTVTLSDGGATMTYDYSYGTGSTTTAVTRVCP